MSLKLCLEGVIFRIQGAAIAETRRILNSSAPWKLIPGRGGWFITNQAIFNCLVRCTFLASTASTGVRQVTGHIKTHCGTEHSRCALKEKLQKEVQMLSESQFLLWRACFQHRTYKTCPCTAGHRQGASTELQQKYTPKEAVDCQDPKTEQCKTLLLAPYPIPCSFIQAPLWKEKPGPILLTPILQTLVCTN